MLLLLLLSLLDLLLLAGLLLLLLLLLTHRNHGSDGTVQGQRGLPGESRGRVLGLLGRGCHRLLAKVKVGMSYKGSQGKGSEHGGGCGRMKGLMLHGCSCGGRSRIVQGRSWMVMVVLQLVLIGCGLLAGGLLLLTGGRLNLGWRLDRCSRNLWLVIAGRSRVEWNRQHLLQAHARNSPRDVPRTRMVLHRLFLLFYLLPI